MRRGVKINGGRSEYEKRLTMIIKRQKQVTIEQKTKIHKEARYFAWKLGLNSTNEKRKYNKEFVKNFIFLKISKREVPIRSKGLEQSRKIKKWGEAY